MTAFDLCGPLPRGTVVLEASAGTGKTFTLAGLTTRYVAEGLATLDQLLVVTFTRAATQELRERVRERMVSAARGLALPQQARTGPDALVRHLADGDDAQVAERRGNLVTALAQFDAATIATTHGFCAQMLAGLGTAADSDRDVEPVDRADDLVEQVVDDLYLARYLGCREPPPLSHATARKVGKDAAADPFADLVVVEAGSPGHERYAFARDVRAALDRRKRSLRLLDHDDLLLQLRDALTDPQTGLDAVERVRRRFQVVLVDEFQDTDPVQWQILRTAFDGAATLVLVGDPKQAIYAFRGADLVTYLGARRSAGDRRELGRNWRSDAGLLRGLEQVLRAAALGEDEIAVRPVEAEHQQPRLTGGPGTAPVRLRVVRRADLGADDAARPAVADLRRLVVRDVADDVVRQLTAPAVLDLGDGPRGLAPGDVAVLVPTHDLAVAMQEALRAARVPAVLAGSRSVFRTRMAQEWLTLLRAVEQPHRGGLVRAAALTCLARRDPAALADPAGRVLDELGTRLRAWRAVLVDRGVAALLEVASAEEDLAARLLATPDGERDLTDLRHIGQSLHAAALRGRLGPAALVGWLRTRIDEAATDADDERSRRLESDAEAVQVVTVHSSKGLEFPVVYVPFGWDRYTFDTPDPLRLHDAQGRRLLDVAGRDDPGYPARRQQHSAEERGEHLRLLYVALTRARCQVVAHWAPSRNTGASPLHRLLFGQFMPGGQPPPTVPVPGDDTAWARLEGLVAAGSGGLAVERLDAPGLRWRPPGDDGAGVLEAAGWRRELDRSWRRTSYTALTAAAHEPGFGSEPEQPERGDEPELPVETGAADADVPGGAGPAVGGPVLPSPLADLPGGAGPAVCGPVLPSPLADLPGGTAFGTLVHAVLERLDTAADDADAELALRCAEAVAARAGSAPDPAALAAGLSPVVRTPLGPLAGGRSLLDVPPADRLAELDFELPLSGGDRPGATEVRLHDLAALLRAHLPPADPLCGYADALLELPAARLRGYLSGSIDAVLRVVDGDVPRYLVVDYKTNWLGDPARTEPLSTWHYRPAALIRAMVGAHYPLQALLYCVALHRFLRWRRPDYDPQRHLGGVLYLFVRGMAGPATPQADGVPCGVFSWQPPAPLVVGLSDQLAGGSA